MNRTEARELWTRIAAGELDPGLRKWLQGVALAIVDADDLPAGVRPGELVRAIGLLGKVDSDIRVKLRDTLEMVDSFPFLEDGIEREPERGERMRSFVAAARASGLVEHDVSDTELRKRIERMIAR